MSVDFCFVDKYKCVIYYIDLFILQKDYGDVIFEWNGIKGKLGYFIIF